MSIKRQPDLEIDWDVVRDTLFTCWLSQGVVEYPMRSKAVVYAAIRKKWWRHDSDAESNYANAVTSASFQYAMDEALVNSSGREPLIDGLTTKGFELLSILDNEWVWEKIRGWASEKGVPLTADIIIKAGDRIILSNLNNSYILGDNVRSYCV